MFYASALAVPFVAALQRYAVAYGYQGLSKAEALRSARGAFVGVGAAVALFVAVRS